MGLFGTSMIDLYIDGIKVGQAQSVTTIKAEKVGVEESPFSRLAVGITLSGKMTFSDDIKRMFLRRARIKELSYRKTKSQRRRR